MSNIIPFIVDIDPNTAKEICKLIYCVVMLILGCISVCALQSIASSLKK